MLRVRVMGDAENKALLWLEDKNVIQRDLRHERSGKISVTESDLSGGQNALTHILRSGCPSREICNALASALEPIGDSLLQLKKRPRRKRGRPSRTDDTRGACYDAFEVHDIGQKIEQERKNPRTKRRQAAAGMMQKKPTLNDTINVIARENKIGLTKASSLHKSHGNLLKNKQK